MSSQSCITPRHVAGARRLLAYASALVVFTLWGCAPKEELTPPTEESEAPAGVYVLAPAAYMIYMNTINPPLLASEGREQDMPVFLTLAHAQAFLQHCEETEQIPKGIWRVYKLEGSWNDVVEPEPGECRMRHPARMFPLQYESTASKQQAL